MEKKGNINGVEAPPPPYGYPPQHNVAHHEAPPCDDYDPNSQKVPLYPQNQGMYPPQNQGMYPPQNPGGPGYPMQQNPGGPGYPMQQNPGGPGYPMAGPQGPYCAQQPIGYGQQQQAVVFVQPQAMANPPQDHLGYSIFVTICCCWIIGLFAIIKSAECRSAIATGDRTTAEVKSRQAKKLSNIALGLGIVSIVASIVLFGVYYGLMMARLNN